MDVTKFDDNSFNAKQWINDTLRKETATNQPHEQSQKMEQFTQQLVTKLQIMQQQLSMDFLHQSTFSFVNKKLPVALLELDKANKLVDRLSKELHQTRQKLQFSDKNEVNVIEQLQTLHLLKQNVQICLDTLESQTSLIEKLHSLELEMLTFENIQFSLENSEELLRFQSFAETISNGYDQVKNGVSLVKDVLSAQEFVSIQNRIKHLQSTFYNKAEHVFLLLIRSIFSYSTTLTKDLKESILLWTDCFMKIDKWDEIISKKVIPEVSKIILNSATVANLDDILKLMEDLKSSFQLFDTLSPSFTEQVLKLILTDYFQKFPISHLDIVAIVQDFSMVTTFFENLPLTVERKNELKLFLFQRFSPQISNYSTEENNWITKWIKVNSKNSFDENFLNWLDNLESVGNTFLKQKLQECLNHCRVLTFGIESQSMVRILNSALVTFATDVQTQLQDIQRKLSQYGFNRVFAQQSLRLVSIFEHWNQFLTQELYKELKQQLLSWSKIPDPNRLKNMFYSNQKLEITNAFLKSVELEIPLLDVAEKKLKELKAFSIEFCLSQFSIQIESFFSKANSTYQRLVDNEDEDSQVYDLPKFKSRPNSEYIIQLADWIVTLPEMLDPTVSPSAEQEEHRQQVKYWVDLICDRLIQILFKKLSQLPESVSQNAWEQILSDMAYLHGILDMINYQNEAFNVLLKVLDGKTLEERKTVAKNMEANLSEVMNAQLQQFLSKIRK